MRRPAAVERGDVQSQRLNLPPLWLAVCAMTAAITVAFGVSRWIDHFTSDPNAEDFSLHVVAADVGISHGWSHIYDLDLMKATSIALTGKPIDTTHVFMAPLPSAWMVVPLAGLPVPTGYAIWTLINLAALIAAWWLIWKPNERLSGSRLARVTVLLVSLAIWPMHYQFWLGQWVVASLALLAVSWWLLQRDRQVLAGIVLAVPFFLKPQLMLLLPVALLVSGRWKPVAAFAVTGAVIGALTALSLGWSGISSWLSIVAQIKADRFQGPLTYSVIFGQGWLATGIEVTLGVAALILAWYRRERLDLVFALGLVGSTASATYLHEDDIAILVLAAWILLLSRPSRPQQVWLIVGIAAAHFIAIGQPIPMLLWEPGWIALFGLEPLLKRLDVRRSAGREPASTLGEPAAP
jgi:multidrug transporter EmrE-like cation transporter